MSYANKLMTQMGNEAQVEVTKPRCAMVSIDFNIGSPFAQAMNELDHTRSRDGRLTSHLQISDNRKTSRLQKLVRCAADLTASRIKFMAEPHK